MSWTCDNCGKNYHEPFLFDDKYCSQKCRNEAEGSNGKSIQYNREHWTCENCGREYTETFEFDDKYCSQKCRDEAD